MTKKMDETDDAVIKDLTSRRAELLELGRAVSEAGSRTTEALYSALAGVARFREASKNHPAELKKLLGEAGVRPALSKSRLDRQLVPLVKLCLAGSKPGNQVYAYAKALAEAEEKGKGGDEVAAFLAEEGNGVVKLAKAYDVRHAPEKAAVTFDAATVLAELPDLGVVMGENILATVPAVLITTPREDGMLVVRGVIDDADEVERVLKKIATQRDKTGAGTGDSAPDVHDPVDPEIVDDDVLEDGDVEGEAEPEVKEAA